MHFKGIAANPKIATKGLRTIGYNGPWNPGNMK